MKKTHIEHLAEAKSTKYMDINSTLRDFHFDLELGCRDLLPSSVQSFGEVRL